jgi:hypothetical protein
MSPLVLAISWLVCGWAFAQAAPTPLNEVLKASGAKRNLYVSDTVVSGGDALAHPLVISSLRWAKNPAGYERLVLDFAGEGSGWESKIPPYFQVGHDSNQGALILSIRGISGRVVQNKDLKKSVARSPLLASAYLAPAIEGDVAALELRTRGPVEWETFYLLNPPRIVLDLRARR